MPTARLLCLVLLAACSPGSVDRDGDAANDEQDCAPDDSRVFPGAPELCDGRDNDCDGAVDEGLATRWFLDVDGDGRGDPDRPVDTCTPPLGAVDKAGDCDDTDPLVFPGALERCDGRDNDCDGRTDETRVWLDFQSDDLGREGTLTGDAQVVDDDERPSKVLRLTRPEAGQTGALWLTDDVPGESFALRMLVRLGRVGPDLGEGLAVALMRGADAQVTDGGGGPRLGLYDTATTGWSVELDPYRNNELDTTLPGPHLAIHDVSRQVPLVQVDPEQAFEDGGWHQLEIVVVGPLVSVAIDGRPVLVDRPVGLGLWPVATVGVTAATSRDRVGAFAVDDVALGCPGFGVGDVDTGVE